MAWNKLNHHEFSMNDKQNWTNQLMVKKQMNWTELNESTT